VCGGVLAGIFGFPLSVYPPFSQTKRRLGGEKKKKKQWAYLQHKQWKTESLVGQEMYSVHLNLLGTILWHEAVISTLV
jgi:hypothetical protein